MVDDGSTDRTREIAESFEGVRVIAAPALPPGWTGKNNAVVAGAAIARGGWLLFTDADTVHVLGSLARAVAEAKEYGVDMLSYSPQQVTFTFWEMAVLPVVFTELAREYAPQKVSDPASRVAAANGQYILIRREAYQAVGGHRAVADSLLEDVALACAVKDAGRKIRFRYAADAVRTRMYRNFRQLREGWTKNLVLLFPNPGQLAAKSILLWGLAWTIILWPVTTGIGVGFTGRIESLAWAHGILLSLNGVSSHWWWNSMGIGGFLFITMRLRLANFTWDREAICAMAGYPMFSYLLWRSKRAHSRNLVSWKGRAYRPEDRLTTSTAVTDNHKVLKTTF